MNEQTQIEVANDAVIESPVVDVPMTVATVSEMMAWRAKAKSGDAFCYFQGPSLMRIRSGTWRPTPWARQRGRWRRVVGCS